MTFVVVDQCAVVELRSAQANRVVCRWREHQKIIVSQKPPHYLFVSGGQEPNTRLLWSVVKPLSQLFKRACGNQFLEMAIDCFTQASKIFTPIDTASLQLVRKVRCGAPEARR